MKEIFKKIIKQMIGLKYNYVKNIYLEK